MPELVYKSASRSCKKQTKIGLLATDATIKTNIYSNFFDKNPSYRTENRRLESYISQITTCHTLKHVKQNTTNQSGTVFQVSF